MAIRRKTETSELNLPLRLEEMLLEGFSYQAIADQYEQAFKAVKVEVEKYLETNGDDFNVDMGKGFKCAQGTVIYQERTTYDYNKDEILQLVQSGEITLVSLLSACNFTTEKLKAVLGETNFRNVSTEKKSESLVFRASSEFKEECKESFYSTLPKFKNDEEEKVEEIKVEKPAKVEKAEKPKSEKVEKISKAKEIAALAREEALGKKPKKKAKSVEDDISSILKK